jgi:hypothetical protein
MMGKGGGYNMEKAFRENVVLIPKNMFANPHTTLHDNLGDRLLSEQIETYTVMIDGFHRDHTSKKNPFDIQAELGGSGDTIGHTYEWEYDTSSVHKNRHKWIKKKVEVTYSGTSAATLGRKLNRIKFVRLTGMIVPSYNKFTYDFDEKKFKYVTDEEDYNLSSALRYIVAKVSELSDERKFATGNFLSNDSYIMRIDKVMGANHCLWIPINRNIVSYKNSSLSTMNKLSIKLYDDDETLIPQPIITYTDKSDSDNEVTKTFNFDDEITSLNSLITDISTGETDVVNPFSGTTDDTSDISTTISQIQALKRRHQIETIFEVGVVENDLNTETQYEK